MTVRTLVGVMTVGAWLLLLVSVIIGSLAAVWIAFGLMTTAWVISFAHDRLTNPTARTKTRANRYPRARTPVERMRPTVPRRLTVEETEHVHANATCPFCDHALWDGPQGGMSTNCFCSNPKCKARLNIPAFVGAVMRGEYVGQSPEELYT